MKSLWDRVLETSAKAKESGALKKIETSQEIISDGGIKFIVSVASRLAEKPVALSNAPVSSPTNPFLPPDPNLLVCELEGTHNLILNKFNVADNHLIMATIDYQPQTDPLTLSDFAVLRRTLNELRVLAFFNSGILSGASQPHKHIQLFPLQTLVEGVYEVPIEPLIMESAEGLPIGTVFQIKNVKFRAACVLLPHSASTEALHDSYLSLLKHEGLDKLEPGGHFPSYNFLLTSKWMLVVPRRSALAETVSVNSLGFAGALLVKNIEDLEFVRKVGPIYILNEVGVPLSPYYFNYFKLI
eukprot:TRINITY_DN5689_c0_g1_i1.p1 TRINITY_DN5689_c0_g1~~TRINITY_DN5689_c0_g1_i1.p1  ORF type:complete len:299 (-),score=48.91 TRINITY_DN5689_c0_g1_i1:40-936(-)